MIPHTRTLGHCSRTFTGQTPLLTFKKQHYNDNSYLPITQYQKCQKQNHNRKNITCLNNRYDGDRYYNNNTDINFRCHSSSIIFVVVVVKLICNDAIKYDTIVQYILLISRNVQSNDYYASTGNG